MPPAMDPIAARRDEGGNVKLMVSDVSRIYSYAPAMRPVCVRIVAGDFEPGDGTTCGRLHMPMYGARDAA